MSNLLKACLFLAALSSRVLGGSLESVTLGNVFGPSGGSTDNAVPRFDGTSGTILKNSSLILNTLGSDVASLSSVGAYLHVNDDLGITGNTSITGNLLATGSVTIDTDTLVVDSVNNRVGIGTTAPGAPLTVVNTTVGQDVIRFTNSIGTYAINDYSFNAPNSFVIQSGSGSGYLNLAAGTFANPNAIIRLYTQNFERMRIDNTGNVGIGTTAPTEKLDVSGNANVSGTLSVAKNSGGTGTVYVSDSSFSKTPGSPFKFAGISPDVDASRNCGFGGLRWLNVDTLAIRNPAGEPLNVILGSSTVVAQFKNAGLDVTGNVSTSGYITTGEQSSDPADPPEGRNITWQSDGTGAGDDGDIMMKITAGGVTKTITLVDFSAF